MTTPQRKTASTTVATVTVRVLLSYLPATAEELPLVEGERVVVTSRADDWLFGHPPSAEVFDDNGRVAYKPSGWFPLVHVESPDEVAESETVEIGEGENGEEQLTADDEELSSVIELLPSDFTRVSGTSVCTTVYCMQQITAPCRNEKERERDKRRACCNADDS
jgi:hypothetical protein